MGDISFRYAAPLGELYLNAPLRGWRACDGAADTVLTEPWWQHKQRGVVDLHPGRHHALPRRGEDPRHAGQQYRAYGVHVPGTRPLCVESFERALSPHLALHPHLVRL
jgi:hypothetical protein